MDLLALQTIGDELLYRGRFLPRTIATRCTRLHVNVAALPHYVGGTTSSNCAVILARSLANAAHECCSQKSRGRREETRLRGCCEVSSNVPQSRGSRIRERHEFAHPCATSSCDRDPRKTAGDAQAQAPTRSVRDHGLEEGYAALANGSDL